MDTNWKPVYGWEGLYEVSSTGEVRSLPREFTNRIGRTVQRKGRVLRPSTSSLGYKRVNLHRSGGSKPSTRTVHSLVLEAFIHPRPRGLLGCHKDGDPSNNRVDNLYWGTPRQNMLDKALHGRDHGRNRTSCPQGHPLKGPNLREEKSRNGWRACKACHQARSDAYNGSDLTFEQGSDMRYFMVCNSLRFPVRGRREREAEMYERAKAWRGGGKWTAR